MFSNCSNGAKKQLDPIHIEAARIITGATKLCSINKLFVDVGWDSLQNRRNKHKLVIFYKIMNDLTLTIFQTVCLLWYKTLLHTTLETLMTYSPFMLILICSITLSFPLLFVLGIPYLRTLNKRHMLLSLNIA